VDVFYNLPSNFLKDLKMACAAVGIMSEDRIRKAMAFCDEIPRIHIEAAGDDDEAQFMFTAQLHESAWETATSQGIARRDFWPATGQRRRTYMSSSFLKFTAIHPEEFMARIRNRELPLFLSEYELLIWLCDEIACGQQASTSRVHRHRYKPGFCLFLHITTTRAFDYYGRLIRMEHVCKPLNIEGLDEVLRHDPDIVQATYMGSGACYSDAGGRKGSCILRAACGVRRAACCMDTRGIRFEVTSNDTHCVVHMDAGTWQARAWMRKRCCQAPRTTLERAKWPTC
jgi:hypothetical protein